MWFISFFSQPKLCFSNIFCNNDREPWNFTCASARPPEIIVAHMEAEFVSWYFSRYIKLVSWDSHSCCNSKHISRETLSAYTLIIQPSHYSYRNPNANQNINDFLYQLNQCNHSCQLSYKVSLNMSLIMSYASSQSLYINSSIIIIRGVLPQINWSGSCARR